jgi:hypothetical protein
MTLRVCKKCNKKYSLSDFYKNRAEKDGIMKICKYCKKVQARESNQRCKPHLSEYRKQYKKNYYELNRDRILLEYHRRRESPIIFLKQVYKTMRARCYNSKIASFPWYGGKGIKVLVDRETFIKWSLKNCSFKRLYKLYQGANFEYKQTPSIDRINAAKSYYLKNMRWVTLSENSKRVNHKNS